MEFLFYLYTWNSLVPPSNCSNAQCSALCALPSLINRLSHMFRTKFNNNVMAAASSSTQALSQVTNGYTTQMKVEKVTQAIVYTWKAKPKFVAINARCYAALARSMPHSDHDAAAITLLLNSVPDMWHRRLMKGGSAHHALHWVLEQFDGPTNEFNVDS
jgi:hypothetical protein